MNHARYDTLMLISAMRASLNFVLVRTCKLSGQARHYIFPEFNRSYFFFSFLLKHLSHEKMWSFKQSHTWLGIFLVTAALTLGQPLQTNSQYASTSRSSWRTLLSEGKTRFLADFPDAKLWKILCWALKDPYGDDFELVEVSNPSDLNVFVMYFYSPTHGYRMLHSQASRDPPVQTWDWPPLPDLSQPWYPWREIKWPPRIDIFDADSDSKKQGENRKYAQVKYHKNDDLPHTTPCEAYTFGQNTYSKAKLWALKVDDETVVELEGFIQGWNGNLTTGGTYNSHSTSGTSVMELLASS